MVFIFGRDLVNNEMESGGKSKLSLNCAGDGKEVRRSGVTGYVAIRNVGESLHP